MNIVKFNDVILDETTAPQLTKAQIDLFNKKFRGKYVYVINWTYCVPFEDMTEEEYIAVSQELSSDIHRHITWKNGDVLLAVTIVPYAEMPVYDGPTPTKEPAIDHTYEFDGWDPELVPATEDTTYYAKFAEHIRQYEVHWVNYDGKLIYSEMVDYGSLPVYRGELPTKPADQQYHYEFVNWDPEVYPVDGDVTYMATYQAVLNQYTVKFVNYDGTILDEQLLDYGSVPHYEGVDPERPETFWNVYTFEGWDKLIEVVTEDTTYTAMYEATPKYHTLTDNTIYLGEAYYVSPDMPEPDDEHNGLQREAAWKVEITKPGYYKITERFESLYEGGGYTGHRWEFTLEDEYGNVIDTFEGPDVWPISSPETCAYREENLWQITNVGLYVLRVKNVMEHGKPILNYLKFDWNK